MGLVDDILDEFEGQLRMDDILHMTYKELSYIRRHRRERNEEKIRRQKYPPPAEK